MTKDKQAMIQALTNMRHACSNCSYGHYGTYECTLARSLYPSSLSEISCSHCAIDRKDLDIVADYCKRHTSRNRYLQLQCDCPLLDSDNRCFARYGGVNE